MTRQQEIEMGRACQWLRRHRASLHVRLSGDVELEINRQQQRPTAMRTHEQIEQEINELEAKQAAAPHWGAAVGARHERLKGLQRELLQLTSTQRPEGK